MNAVRLSNSCHLTCATMSLVEAGEVKKIEDVDVVVDVD